MQELETQCGELFVKSRHGTRQTVILEKVRRNRVTVREIDHTESFSIPIAQFLKFFQRKKKSND